jgi:hypothetical protein
MPNPNPDRPQYQDTIEETWGQAVADMVVRRYATTADRDADLGGFTPAELAGQVVAILLGGEVFLQRHDGAAWRGEAGRVLGYHEFCPAGNANFNTPSSTFVAVEPGGALRFSFIAPPSGRVLYRLRAATNCTAGYVIAIAWLAGGMAGQAGLLYSSAQGVSSSYLESAIYGLTPGAVYQIEPGWEAGGGAGGIVNMYYGQSGYGPINQEVIELDEPIAERIASGPGPIPVDPGELDPPPSWDT